MENIACCLPALLRLPVASELAENTANVKKELVKKHVLSGPRSSGKTSLLFEYAFRCAEGGDTVLYIAPKPLTRLPLLVNGRVQPNSEVLKRINMIYLSSFDELINYFSNVHLEKIRSSPQGRSRHLLIDDFDRYFQEKGTRTEETSRLAKCMAYIIDALDFWSKST